MDNRDTILYGTCFVYDDLIVACSVFDVLIFTVFMALQC